MRSAFLVLRGNRFGKWLAMSAMALNALWPLISQAQPKEPELFTTICTLEGMQTVELPVGKVPFDDSAGKHQKHCKLCIGGNDRTQALVSAPADAFRSPIFAVESPSALPAAEVRATSASLAQPRAPPALS
jgi:hypothetical protein